MIMGKYFVQLKDGHGNKLLPAFGGSVIKGQSFCYFGSHRGKNNYPENTMPAFKAAYEAGFKMLEVDLVQSSDGVQFCLHDATIDRTSNGTGTASEMTAAELLSYDYGYPSIYGTQFEGTTIPTLREVCIFCKNHGMLLELDLADASRYNNSYLQTTYNVVKACGMLDNVFFCALPAMLRELIKIDPTVRMSVSGQHSVEGIDSAKDILDYSRGSNFSINSVYIEDSSLIDYVHNLGHAVKSFTVNSSGTARTLFNYGVECILTDSITPSGFIID